MEVGTIIVTIVVVAIVIFAVPRGEPPSTPARILQASLKSQNKPEPNYAAQAQPAERAISVDELNAPISN